MPTSGNPGKVGGLLSRPQISDDDVLMSLEEHELRLIQSKRGGRGSQAIGPFASKPHCCHSDEHMAAPARGPASDAPACDFADKLEELFPSAVTEEAFIKQMSSVLNGHGFTKDTSINLVSTCRDELCRNFTDLLDSEWSPHFCISSLAGFIFCGKTGFKAAMAHSPEVNGKERYVFWVAPHIALAGDGEVGKCSRPHRNNPSSACGALLGVLGELKNGTMGLRLDQGDIEQSLVKQELRGHLPPGHIPSLVELTYAAYECILREVQTTAKASVDPSKCEFAIVAGIQIHGPGGQNYFWPGHMTVHDGTGNVIDVHDEYANGPLDRKLQGWSESDALVLLQKRGREACLAAERGDLAQLKRLPMSLSLVRDHANRTLLHVAAMHNQLEVVRHLAAKNPGLMGAQDAHKCSAMDYAVDGQFDDVAHVLKAHGGGLEGQRLVDGLAASVEALDLESFARYLKFAKRREDVLQAKDWQGRSLVQLALDIRQRYAAEKSKQEKMIQSLLATGAEASSHPTVSIGDLSLLLDPAGATREATVDLGLEGGKNVPACTTRKATDKEMYPKAQENFKRWNDALKAKDYKKVASLYSNKKLSFLPTVSPKFIKGETGIKDTEAYFVDFVKKLPDGIITSDDVQAYGDDAYLHSGMYTFMTGPPEDRQPVNARFSYMWRLIDGDWQIVHHHSSAVPGQAPKETTDEEMYPLAQENFMRWNDALVARDFKKVAGLYSNKELSFLPTVSPKFVQDLKGTEAYFVEFVKKLPVGTITEDKVFAYGPDAYLHSGMYTFMTGPADERAPVNARFSYMWRKIDGAWKIVHHHSSAVPGAAKKATDKEMYPKAQENFKRWNDALKAKDYKKVASLYSNKKLSFLPTVSPKFIKGETGIKDTEAYFVDFVKKLPDGIITSDDVQAYGDDAYLHSGMYTFMTGPPEDRQPVNARFSYMWRLIDGDWQIVHHHSSAVPQPGAKAEPTQDTYTIGQENPELEGGKNVPAGTSQKAVAGGKLGLEAGGSGLTGFRVSLLVVGTAIFTSLAWAWGAPLLIDAPSAASGAGRNGRGAFGARRGRF